MAGAAIEDPVPTGQASGSTFRLVEKLTTKGSTFGLEEKFTTKGSTFGLVEKFTTKDQTCGPPAIQIPEKSRNRPQSWLSPYAGAIQDR